MLASHLTVKEYVAPHIRNKTQTAGCSHRSHSTLYWRFQPQQLCRGEKKKSIQIGKKTVKLFLFSDDMILYVEKPKKLRSQRVIWTRYVNIRGTQDCSKGGENEERKGAKGQDFCERGAGRDREGETDTAKCPTSHRKETGEHVTEKWQWGVKTRAHLYTVRYENDRKIRILHLRMPLGN